MDEEPKSIRYNPKHKRPLEAWYRDISIRKECHRQQAVWHTHMDKILNAIVVTLSAFATSAIFSSYTQTKSGDGGSTKSYLPMIGGTISVISTILQSLQKALHFTELAEQHKIASKQFTKLQFRLELITGRNFEDDGTLNMDRLTDWTREYQDLLESTPLIKGHVYAKYQNKQNELSDIMAPLIISDSPLHLVKEVVREVNGGK